MFIYNPKANYRPDGGRYIQILSGKDLYKQTIIVSARDTFLPDFQIFLLIICWERCMWVIECGQIGTKLLCDYGKHSYISLCSVYQVLVGLVLHI